MYAGVWLTAIIETISAALGAQVAPKGLLHFLHIFIFRRRSRQLEDVDNGVIIGFVRHHRLNHSRASARF